MAKPNIYLQAGANVESTDTFASWVETTNQLVYDMGTVVLTSVTQPQPNTSVGGITTGNSHIEGIFSANTLVAATALRGGTVSGSALLSITSNTTFADTNQLIVGANTNNFTVNANNSTFTSNFAINNAAKTVSINAANTTITNGALYVQTPSTFSGTSVSILGTSLTATSNTTITAATLNANVDIITLGFNGSDTLNVNSVSDFNANVNIDGVLTSTNNAIFSGALVNITSANTTIGDASTDALNVNATSDFNAAVNIDGLFTSTANATFTGAKAQFDNDVIIGATTADTVYVNSYLGTDLLPANTTIDLGSSAKYFGNTYSTCVLTSSDVISSGELVLSGSTAKNLRILGSAGSYQNLNLIFSNNSVSNTAIVANTSGLFGGLNQLYSLGSSSVNWKDLYVQNSFVTADQVVTGDVAVNGGDITTSALTFNLLNTTATTLNIGGAATAVNVGATTGTLTINNPTVAGTQATQNLWNTAATTVNAFGAGTSVNLGAMTGTFKINNPTVIGSQTTQNLFNTVATTVNAFGAATAISIGAATGTTTVNNDLVITGDATVNGGDIFTSATTFNLLNATATTVNAFGAATVITIGANGTGQTNIRTANTVFTGGVVDSSAATANIINTPTTVNAFKAATALSIGAATGTSTINNDLVVTGDVAVNGGDITTSTTTFNLLNTTATTVNAFGAGGTINLGNLTTAQTINIGAGATATATTKTINLGTAGVAGSTTNVNIGSNSGGTLTINSPTIAGPTSVNLLNTSTTVTAFSGAMTSLALGSTTGASTLKGSSVTLDTPTVSTTATNLSLFSTPTTVTAFGGTTTALSLGSTTGASTLKGSSVTFDTPTVATTATTLSLYGTTATTINAFTVANALNIATGTASAPVVTIGGGGGDTTLNLNAATAAATVTIGSNITTGKLKILPAITTGSIEIGAATGGTANIAFTTQSTSISTGALTTAGGVGITKNLWVGGTLNVAGASTLASATVTGNISTATIGTSGLATLNSATVTTSLGTATLSTSGLATLNSANVVTDAVVNGALSAYGSAVLYYGGSANKKFETTSAGVTVTGTATITGDLTVLGSTTLSTNTAFSVNTSITNTMTVNTNLLSNGNTSLGDASTDYVTINGSISSNIIPMTTNTYDIGSTTKTWNNVYANTMFVNTTNYAYHSQSSLTVTTASTTQSTLVSFSKAAYQSAEITITAKQAGTSPVARHVTKLLITHDDTTAFATEYGTVFTVSSLASYDVDINTNNVRILVTPASSATTTYNVVMSLTN